MATSAKWHGGGWLKSVIEAAWAADQIDVSLHSSAWTPNQDTDLFWDDISATELGTSGGYTAGGSTLGTKSTTYTDASNKVAVFAADVSWTASGAGFTARYASIRKNTGVASTSPIVGHVDFGGDQAMTTAGWILTVDWDPTTGVGSVTVS